MTLRIPVYSIINNSRRDLSIHLNSIDFTLVQISSHVWFLEKRNDQPLLRLNHVTKERHYFQEKQRSRRERERERACVGSRRRRAENWEKLLSYARLRVPWINLGISPRQVAGWSRMGSRRFDRSTPSGATTRVSLSLSLSRWIFIIERSLAVEVGDTFVKKRGREWGKRGEKKSGTPPIAACFLRFSRKTTSALLEMRPRRDTQRSTLFSWWKVVETVVPL